MPKGPQGQKRPANAIGMSAMVAKIATGEVQETKPTSGRRASGIAGGKARAASLSGAERSKIAEGAAEARWSKEAIMNNLSESQILAQSYKNKIEAGLIDVKFSIKNAELTEEVCAEINRLDKAIARNEFKPLVFGDSRTS